MFLSLRAVELSITPNLWNNRVGYELDRECRAFTLFLRGHMLVVSLRPRYSEQCLEHTRAVNGMALPRSGPGVVNLSSGTDGYPAAANGDLPTESAHKLPRHSA